MQSTTRAYKSTSGGHAPGHIRDAFLAAVEAYQGWRPGQPEPTVDFNDQRLTISQVCGLVWNCTDILPGSESRIIADGEQPEPATYAAGARMMKRTIASLRKPRELAIEEAVRNGVRRFSTPRLAGTADHDPMEFLAEFVLETVPDCTYGEFTETVDRVRGVMLRNAIVANTLADIWRRFGDPNNPEEKMGFIVQRAAAAGDVEAIAVQASGVLDRRLEM